MAETQFRGGGAAAAAFRTLVPDSVRPRVTGAYRPLLYRGDRVECPCCGGRFDRMVTHRGHPNVRCPRCGSMERHRLLWSFLRDRTDLLTRPQRLVHFAPEWPFLRLLKRQSHLDYVTADLESRLARDHFDIQDIPYPDASADAILCNHVLEHIPDDRAAIAGLHRILKPGGWAILMVPIGRGVAHTFSDPAVTTPEQRLATYGQEDHVRLYGADYPDRLREAGFDVASYRLHDLADEREIARLALGRVDPFFDDDEIFVATRQR
jgi:SAM-dependent methyltransferase